MSRIKRFASALLALIMLLSLCGCDPMSLLPSDYDVTKLERAFNGGEPVRDESLSFAQIEYSRPDVEAIEQLCGRIEELLDEHASRKDVISSLNDFFDMYANFRTMLVLASIYNDLDVSDEFYADEYVYCSVMWGKVQSFFEDVLMVCYNSHMSAFLDANYFNGYLDESYGNEDGFAADGRLVELQERESELLNDYRGFLLEINASDSYDVYEEYNESVAEIYIELIKLRREIAEEMGYESYIEYAYDGLGREYEPEELEEYTAAVKAKLVPLYKELNEKGAFYYMYYDLREVGEAETMSILSSAAEKMGGDIYDSLQFMKNSGLYDISGGEAKLDASYVTYLDDYNVPFLFSKTYGFADDILTVGHEFGHFVDYYINYGSDISNDSAEMFSQGMEYLLLEYIGNEELAAELTHFKLLDALYLYVSQLSFNDFEERVYALSDKELTVDNINAIYAEVAGEYGYAEDYDSELLPYLWIDISHLFEQPFYVISYCVSDSAAFGLYELELENPGKGLAAYMDLVDVCDEYGFLELLDNEGLPSPLSADAVSLIADTLRSRLAA